MRKNFSFLLVIFLSFTLLSGLVFTWPLAQNFFTSIPYTLKPIPGFEKVPLMPGDHLQTYYWFWLLSDNFFGHSSLFTNPYEFNGPLGSMSSVYANFPFSLLYLLMMPLGHIGAYNALIILSFMLSGLAMFLLSWTWTKDFWATLMAGLVFAVVPYRVSHVAGGQLFGYVIFLLPLVLYFVEMTFEKGRWVYGLAAGLTLVLMSLMDPHTSYLTALTVGVYLPSRILLVRSFPLVQDREGQSFWPGLLETLAGGLSISSFLWIRLGAKSGLPFWHPAMIQPYILGIMSALLFWFYLSALLSRLTTLTFADARHRIGKTYLLFLPLWLYALRYRLEVPHLGLILLIICLGLFLAFLIGRCMKHRDRLSRFNWSSIIVVMIGVGLGLATASAYLLHIRNTVFLPSLASKGRTIQEVLLFSPKVNHFFFWQDINHERFVLLGWGLIMLAFFGLVSLFRTNPINPGKKALAGVLAFLALVLTLGPTLNYFPVYEILYRHFPFFNYPRVPGRFVMVGILFLCLLAALIFSEIREWLTARGWKGLKRWLPLLVIPLVLVEYITWRPLGLSVMTGYDRMYKEIGNRLHQGRVVLELPIWPGDSHQSSAYEYTVTRTRKPMVNGYAPVVFRDYIKKVFWPLYPLDQGELGVTQGEELNKLKVDLITFHDNSMIYTEKISPFPPRLALKRLMASPHLELVTHEGDMSLFKFKSSDQESSSDQKKFLLTSPVQAVFYLNHLPQETGGTQWDPSASGYCLLMGEKGLNQNKFIPRPGARGNVIYAKPGRDLPGYLTLGTHRFFPSGKYRARFRVKAGSTNPELEVGRIDLLEDRSKTVGQKVLRGGDFPDSENWTDIPIEFELSQTREIGFRVFFSGKASLAINVVIIAFSDQNSGPGSVEAEDLLRQTGMVVSDLLASGKEAVFAKAGYHPPIYLCYGPYRTFEPGSFRADFFMRLKGGSALPNDTQVALLEVATDLGKRVLANRLVKIEDLTDQTYRPIGVDFKVPFRCELGYRVKFLDRADLLVDRMEVVDSRKSGGKR